MTMHTPLAMHGMRAHEGPVTVECGVGVGGGRHAQLPWTRGGARRLPMPWRAKANDGVATWEVGISGGGWFM